jgi:hypothetical protein
VSTDWNIRCVDCGDTHHFNDANHQNRLMLDILSHQEAIAAIAPLLRTGDVELETFYGNIDAAWFAKHLGHNLLPIDEYGRLLDQCHECAKCSCGFEHPCTLPAKHEGEHVATRAP